jgi:hypothetical protein
MEVEAERLDDDCCDLGLLNFVKMISKVPRARHSRV